MRDSFSWIRYEFPTTNWREKGMKYKWSPWNLLCICLDLHSFSAHSISAGIVLEKRGHLFHSRRKVHQENVLKCAILIHLLNRLSVRISSKNLCLPLTWQKPYRLGATKKSLLPISRQTVALKRHIFLLLYALRLFTYQHILSLFYAIVVGMPEIDMDECRVSVFLLHGNSRLLIHLVCTESNLIHLSATQPSRSKGFILFPAKDIICFEPRVGFR